MLVLLASFVICIYVFFWLRVFFSNEQYFSFLRGDECNVGTTERMEGETRDGSPVFRWENKVVLRYGRRYTVV